eukprot:489751-Ditylum_brightwellii.AAC.1
MQNAEWVLWEHTGGTKRDPNAWKENMEQLCKFKIIEDFWQYFNHMPKPFDMFYDGETRKRLRVRVWRRRRMLMLVRHCRIVRNDDQIPWPLPWIQV